MRLDSHTRPLTSALTFNQVLAKHDRTYLIMSPPRCSSTAFARVFWQQPAIGYYSHEPFEVVYYNQEPLPAVIEKLANPLELKEIQGDVPGPLGNSLVIKEMPYQVRDYFPHILDYVEKPIIFLIRDPRLNIASRMEKKVAVGANPLFPQIESGWELILSQIDECKRRGIPYLIVDSTDFRNFPRIIFEQIFSQLALPFSEEMLRWPRLDHIDLDNLDGGHSHLYARVLHSTGLQPANEPVPALTDFPHTEGFRAHVDHCMNIYQSLRQDRARVRVN